MRFCAPVRERFPCRESYVICVQDRHIKQPAADCLSAAKCSGSPSFLVTSIMKDFSNASFPPELISVMEAALDAAVASLPSRSTPVTFRLSPKRSCAAHAGERDPMALQRLALLELQLIQR